MRLNLKQVSSQYLDLSIYSPQKEVRDTLKIPKRELKEETYQKIIIMYKIFDLFYISEKLIILPIISLFNAE